MGYRNKISLLSKDRHQIIKGMTNKQLEKWWLAQNENADVDDGRVYVPMYDLSEEIYEMGKYCDNKYLKPFKKMIFDKPAVNKRFNDEGEFFIIGQDGLKAIIENYHEKILKYYKEILEPNDQDVRYGWNTTPEKHIRDQIKEWDKNQFDIRPYCLRMDSPDIVSSWKFEYTIFELVRLYKTIDYEKYEVCLTGW